MILGINSASNAVRKCEIVWGEAECYFTLPDCIASAKYHSIDHHNYYKLILHLPCNSWVTAVVEHFMVLLLKNLMIEARTEKLSCYCCMLLFWRSTEGSYWGSDIDRCGCGCRVRVQYGIEVEDESSMPSAVVAPLSSSSALLLFKKVTIEGQKTQSLPLLQPRYHFYTPLKGS